MSAAPLTHRVRAERSQRGWSQAELAQRSGLSRAEISALETGRLASPSTSAALRLAAAFNLTVEDLFSLADPSVDVEWAWAPPREGARSWLAEVEGRPLRYPCEPTLRGAVSADGPALSAPPRRTVVIAGCDPAIGILAADVERSSGVRVLALTRSSRTSLQLLASGAVHMAGVHLGPNASAARRALGRDQAVLTHVATWEAGLALAPSARIKSVRAALRSRLRWVARAEGSGARRCLDCVIAAEVSERPPRLDHVARDHLGVAATIQSGWAQLGPCLRLVADEAGLGFLSIEQQAYDLVTRASLVNDPAVAAVLASLRSRRLRLALSGLSGYDPSRAGTEQRS
ncbi:MAG: helix-turn-helix domain-containing protein [Planctomycetes bacterium]|nr:helix-turn-helix domain-containing protein [Planctomycetota bacterium]